MWSAKCISSTKLVLICLIILAPRHNISKINNFFFYSHQKSQWYCRQQHETSEIKKICIWSVTTAAVNVNQQQLLQKWAWLHMQRTCSATQRHAVMHRAKEQEWKKCSYANVVRKQKNGLVVSDRWCSSRLISWHETDESQHRDTGTQAKRNKSRQMLHKSG